MQLHCLVRLIDDYYRIIGWNTAHIANLLYGPYYIEDYHWIIDLEGRQGTVLRLLCLRRQEVGDRGRFSVSCVSGDKKETENRPLSPIYLAVKEEKSLLTADLKRIILLSDVNLAVNDKNYDSALFKDWGETIPW